MQRWRSLFELASIFADPSSVTEIHKTDSFHYFVVGMKVKVYNSSPLMHLVLLLMCACVCEVLRL